MERPDLEQLLREGFERWNRGDRVPDPERTDPDVEIVSASDGLTGRGSYRGYEGVRRWVEDMSESFDEWTIELDEFDEFVPGRGLAVGSVHLRGRASGATLDIPCAWLIDHREGRVRRLEAFPNRVDEARAIAARR